MAMDRSLFEQKIAQLRQEYRAQLPKRITEVGELAEMLVPEPWPRDIAHTLRQRLHQFTGSAATFNLPELGAAAQRSELALKPWVEQAQPPTPAVYAEIIHALTDFVELARTFQIDCAHAAATRTTPDSFADLPTVSTPITRNEQRPGAPMPQNGNGRTIALFEDDPAAAADLTLQLRHFGYDVQLLPDLAALPALLNASRPAAVIMDIMFPEGDRAGITALVEFQAAGSTLDDIPIIFTSAREDFTARLAAVRAGAAAYFVKPLNIGALIDTIDRLTGLRVEEPLRVLCVDDDQALTEMYAAGLRNAGIVTRIVSDPKLATNALRNFQADLLLLDMHMPGCTGLELAAVIRQQPAYTSLPIVFLSAETDPIQQATARDHGGDDFLTKPISTAALVHAVTTRAQRARSMRALMIRDSLTGLLNHSATATLLEIEVERAQRSGIPLSVVMLDIDYFKNVNDTYGHGVGDSVLRDLARLLQQRLRRSDVIGRYGGEEFLLILPGMTGTTTLQRLDAIRMSFAALRHPADTGSFHVTFSAGIATLRTQYSDPIRIMQAADSALYAAKRNGRNQVYLT